MTVESERLQRVDPSLAAPGDALAARTMDWVEPLTEREREVLRLIGTGATNAEIAAQLIVSIGTVKWYTTQIYGKLGVKSRVHALVRSRELGLLK